MKDFQKLKEYLEGNKEIKTKDAIALGYSNHDLKAFLASSLLEKKDRGVYVLTASMPTEELASVRIPSAPEEEQPIPVVPQPLETQSIPAETATETYSKEQQMNYEAIGHIFNKEYDIALSKFRAASSLAPRNGYYNMGISYVYFLKEDYQAALENILICIDKHGEHQSSLLQYLILKILSRYVDVNPDVITRIAANLDLTLASRNFRYKIYRNIEREDYISARKALYFFVKSEAANHKYILSNRYLYDLLDDIIDKLGVDYITAKVKEKEQTAHHIVVVPEINSKQILTNAILLQALEDGDYDAALQKVEEYEITDAKAIIISLINKLREATTRGASYLSEPTRVVSEEPAIVVPATIEESLTSIYPKEKVYPMLPEELLNAREEPRDIPNEEPVPPEALADVDVYEGLLPEKPTEPTSDPVAPVTLEEPAKPAPTPRAPEDYFVLYSDAMDCCDFDSAKRALFKYDTMLKQLSNYQNLTYLFDRVNRAKEEYTRNPKRYQEKISLLNKVYSLMIRREYDAALETISSLPACQEKYLLSAELNRLLGNNVLAARQISLVSTTCQEPDYYRIQAELSAASFQFPECLEYCIKYNERCPKENARIYILMADCYEKLHKPAKAAKVLRIADEINRENGSSKNLKSRISHNEQVADKNRLKRLSKLNKQEFDD